MVLVPAPPLTEEEGGSLEDLRDAEERLKAKAREAVIQRFEDAGMADFRSSIVDESIRGPLEWKALFNLRRGSVFGIAHPMDQLSLFRPAPEHPKLRNLFSVGASTRPGNGVPLVLVGAQQVANSILAREKELAAARRAMMKPSSAS
uniref:Phytoene desaturase n=1 Tax=Lotharella oceanica TaxID=641309 RepID=A0A7S2XFR3_9EUKA|mmetsp:Transcript_4983/g.9890  ORF Transcript_4983/g.9890 Transcript_4983/m.9890 type:complete len:147 (+) Transcript_4983:461-901(+)